MSEICTITTVRGALDAGSRCVGFYHDFEKACDVVQRNICDINEMGYYPYAVIEVVGEGIYAYPRKEFWYKWNHDTERYEDCPKPEKFKQVVGWSVG